MFPYPFQTDASTASFKPAFDDPKTASDYKFTLTYLFCTGAVDSSSIALIYRRSPWLASI
jgi:hypothetical protein